MQTIFDIISKKDLCYYENKYDYVEKNFFMEMINIIKRKPYIWKDVLEHIIKNSFITSFKDDEMIIAYDYLPKSKQISFDYIINKIYEFKYISEKRYIKGFIIIKMYSNKVLYFFRKSGLWLNYLTYIAFNEISNSFKQGIYILWNNEFKSSNEIQLLGTLNNLHYIIECKDTYLYYEKDFIKLTKISKKLNKNIRKIFVVTKLLDSQKYLLEKYNIHVIQYKYNYNEFIENIKKLII